MGAQTRLCRGRWYEEGQEILAQWVGKDSIETRLIDGLGHNTNNVVLRGMLRFFNAVFQPEVEATSVHTTTEEVPARSWYDSTKGSQAESESALCTTCTG